MILRIILIALLVIILSKPFIKQQETVSEIKPKDKIYLILIDDTLSSAYAYPTKPLIDTLKNDAVNFINKAEDGATFGLISMNSPLSKPFYSKSKQDVINRISFINYDEDYKPNVKERLKEYLKDLENRPEKEKYLAIFSDFQKIDWKDINITNNIQTMIKYIPKDNFANYSIYNASSPEIINYIGQPINLYFNLDLYSSKDGTAKIKALDQNNILSTDSFMLKHNTKNINNIQIKLYKEGKTNIELKIHHDKYKFDNSTNTNIYTLKSLDILLLIQEEEKIILKALTNAFGTEYERRINLVNIDNKITPNKKYDLIVSYNITNLNEKTKEYLINKKNDTSILIIYSDKDNAFLLEETIKQIFSNNIILKEKLYDKTTIEYPNDALTLNNPFQKLYLNNYNVHFSSKIKADINVEELIPYINYKDGNNMLIGFSNNPPIYLITGDISINHSNILISQVFPMIMNKIAYTCVVNQIPLEKNNSLINVNDNNIEYKLKEGELIYLSQKEIRNIFSSKYETVLYEELNEINEIFISEDDYKKNIDAEKTNYIIILILCLFLGFTLIEIGLSFMKKG